MSPSNANGPGTNGKGGDGTGLSDEDEAALEL
jgi:hypothetical protein